MSYCIYFHSFAWLSICMERNVVCSRLFCFILNFTITDLIPFVLPDVAFLLEQIHVVSSNCYAAINLVNAFFQDPLVNRIKINVLLCGKDRRALSISYPSSTSKLLQFFINFDHLDKKTIMLALYAVSP